jgi:hypothetical protein
MVFLVAWLGQFTGGGARTAQRSVQPCHILGGYRSKGHTSYATTIALPKRDNLYYVSWKYRHSCKLHVQALGLVVAYDMYCDVLEEGFAEFGFENKEAATKKCFLDFHAFHDKLSRQGIRYNPEDCKYKGDRKMRVNTKRGKST